MLTDPGGDVRGTHLKVLAKEVRRWSDLRFCQSCLSCLVCLKRANCAGTESSMKSDFHSPSITRTGTTWFWLIIACLLWIGACLWALNLAGFSFPTAITRDLQSDSGSLTPPAPVGGTGSVVDSSAIADTSVFVPVKPDSGNHGHGDTARQLAEEERRFRLQAEASLAEATQLAEQEKLSSSEENPLQGSEVVNSTMPEGVAVETLEFIESLGAVESAGPVEPVALAERVDLVEPVEPLEAFGSEKEERPVGLSQVTESALQEIAQPGSGESVSETGLVEDELVATGLLEDDAGLQADVESSSPDLLIAPVSDALAADQAVPTDTVNPGRDFARLRSEELSVLSGLSARIRFLPGSAELSESIERALDRMFGPLYLYSDVKIDVSVASNEFSEEASDERLSRDRGRAVVAYLVNRGLEKDRFRIRLELGGDLPSGTHRVKVSTEEVIE